MSRSRVICAALCLALGAVSGAPAVVDQTDPDAAFILTNATVAGILAVAGTSRKQVIATTFRLDGERTLLYMLRNFASWLQKAGLLQHTLLITQDEPSWRALLAEGLPCFLDRASPTEQDFPEGHRYADRTFDFSKNFWALSFLRQGYSLLYLDSDVIVLRDPLRALGDAPYDLQGLSDFRPEPAPELPAVGGLLTQRCGLYRQKRGTELEGGDVLHPSWELQGAELATSQRGVAPCLSLGLWYMAPSPQALRFLETVIDWIVNTHHHQWDQAAWNEVLPFFLMGMGTEPPLRFRLLPLEQYANIEVWQARKERGLAVDPAILHAGFMKGEVKAEQMKALGLWKPDAINSKKATAVLQRYRTSAAAGTAPGGYRRAGGGSAAGGSGVSTWLLLGGGLLVGAAWWLRRRRGGTPRGGRTHGRTF